MHNTCAGNSYYAKASQVKVDTNSYYKSVYYTIARDPMEAETVVCTGDHWLT